jgi:hypothetical protein
MPRLRLVSCNVGGLRAAQVAAIVRPLRPDIVVIQQGPWRLRWRTPTANLAAALGLVHAGGGKPSVGNALLVRLRVQIESETPIRFPLVPGRPMRGALISRCRLGESRLVVVGARLADDPDERAAQRAILARTLRGTTDPVVVCGDLIPPLDGFVQWGAGPAVILAAAGMCVGPVEAPDDHGAMAVDITLGTEPRFPTTVPTQ